MNPTFWLIIVYIFYEPLINVLENFMGDPQDVQIAIQRMLRDMPICLPVLEAHGKCNPLGMVDYRRNKSLPQFLEQPEAVR